MTTISKFFSSMLFKRRVQIARKAAKVGDWATAAREYGRANALRPNLAWLHVQHAHALKEAKLPTEAAIAYQRALDLDGNDEETHYHLIAVLRDLGLKEEAERATRRVVALVESSAIASGETPYILLSRLKARAQVTGFPASVVKAHNDGLADKLTAEGLVQYGHFLKDNGYHAEAGAQYRRSLVTAPRNGDTYLNLGHSLKLQGRIHDAIAAYRTSFYLTVSSNDSTHIHASDELKALNVRLDEAVVLPELLRTRPFSDALQYHISRREWSLLSDKLLDLLKSDNDVALQEFTAQILMLIGENGRAHELLREVLSNSWPLSDAMIIILARDKEAGGFYDEAAELYGKALSLSMQYGEAFESLVRLRKHELLFQILEPELFPRSPSIKNGSVTVPAGGRTAAMQVSSTLAASLCAEFAEKGNRLEQEGYAAQARLYRADAALFPIVH